MVLSAGLGGRVRRREDPRLVTGAGTYVDDLSPTGLCHLVFVRGYLAHAVIRSVDVATARAAPGVIAVITATDLEGLPSFAHSGPRGSRVPDRPLLNARKVRFIGDLIGFVVAETLEQARDAADLFTVELQALPAVVDSLRADDAQAPIIHDALETNLADKSSRLWGDIAGAFSGAHRVVRARIRNQRLAGIPIEPRGVLAISDRWQPSVTVWSATQVPHSVRDEIAAFLDLPQSLVRVIAPEVGGGFGAKLSVYPEELLVPWAAMRVGRPVKWIEDRSENLQATTHGRDQIHDAELAVNADAGRHPQRVHKQDADRGLPGRRPAGGHLPDRADDGSRGPRAASRPGRNAPAQPPPAVF